MRPVRVSNRVRSCVSIACTRASSADSSAPEGSGAETETAGADSSCSVSWARRASRYRAASRACWRASANAVWRRRASASASCTPDRSVTAGAKVQTCASSSRRRRRQEFSLSSAASRARRALSSASAACCRRGRYSAICTSSAVRWVSAKRWRSRMACCRTRTAKTVATAPRAAMPMNSQKGSAPLLCSRKASVTHRGISRPEKMGRNREGAFSGTMAAARCRSSGSAAG